MRVLSDLMAQNAGNSYTLRNKKGGFFASAIPKETIGLSYSSIQYQGNNNGAEIDRSIITQDIPNKLLATEQVSALPLLQKFTTYGTPSDTSLPFSYNSVKHVGGKKTKKIKRRKY